MRTKIFLISNCLLLVLSLYGQTEVSPTDPNKYYVPVLKAGIEKYLDAATLVASSDGVTSAATFTAGTTKTLTLNRTNGLPDVTASFTDLGVSWSGQNGEIAYGQLGNLASKSALRFDNSNNILTSSSFQTGVGSGMYSEMLFGSSSFLVRSTNPNQIVNPFSYTNNTDAGGAFVQEAVMGYRRTSSGPTAVEGWFLSVRNSVGGSASYADRTLSVTNAHLNMEGNPIVGVSDPTAPQDAATKSYVDAQLGGTSDGNGIYSASGSTPAGTVITSPQTGFATGYFQFGANATGPLNNDDNFPFFGFGHRISATNFGQIGFTMEGDYELPSLLSHNGRVNAQGSTFTNDSGLTAGLSNTGATFSYSYSPDGGPTESYAFPREMPTPKYEGAWVYDSAGVFQGFSEGISLSKVKLADETKSLSGQTVDGDLNITGIPAGLYDVEITLVYEGNSTVAALGWFINTNASFDASRSGYRKLSAANNIRLDWGSPTYDAVTTINVDHQTEVIGGTAYFDADGGQFRLSWGGQDVVNDVTLKETSFIKLTRVYKP